ncbi:hypothetical protein Tco_0088524 [Tanacetum coccineum]
MSKSSKPHPSFYNNDFHYLAYLSTEEKYTTSLTKHYAARYYIQGIEDMVSYKWSKDVHHYQIEALNGIHHWKDTRQDFFKAEINNRTLGSVYSDKDRNSLQFGSRATNRSLPYKTKLYFDGIDEKIPYTMTGTEKRVVYLNKYNRRSLMKLNEVYKLCDGTLMKIQENLIEMITKNKLGQGNETLRGRDWNYKDVKRSKEMVDKIDQVMKHREML